MAKREIAAKTAWTLVCLGLMAAVAMAPRQQPAQADGSNSPIVVPPPSVGSEIKLDHAAYAFSKAQNSIGHLHATLRLVNHSNRSITFSEHGRRFEWQILDDKNKVVWDYSVGRRFPHFMMNRTLAPNAHLDYSNDIPMREQDGRPLPSGHYTLRGRVDSAVGAWMQTGFKVTETE